MALQSSSEANFSNQDTTTNYLRPLIVIISLFSIWGIMGAFNDILTNHLKKVFTLTELQASFVQFSFFIGYFLAAIPAGMVMNKIGYKRGILMGLLLNIIGCVIFIIAADSLLYIYLLGALLIVAIGCTFLEVAANPYASMLGNPKTAASRLNVAQGFNALGKTLAAKIGGDIILHGENVSVDQIKLMDTASYIAFQTEAILNVKTAYFALIALLLVYCTVVFFSKLPEIKQHEGSRSAIGSWSLPKHLWLGVLGLFLYVGAQEAIAGKVLSYLEYLNIPGLESSGRTWILSIFLGLFMFGRFAGAYIQTKVDPAKTLLAFAALSGIATLFCVFLSGWPAVIALLCIGFLNSIQFSTIFTLAIHDLGAKAKSGSTFLVMAICGAAIMPLIMGYISTVYNIKLAFIVPFFCYAYVIFYAVKGSKVRTE
jgi:FHS family L-fucose permease-like MFS transporter